MCIHSVIIIEVASVLPVEPVGNWTGAMGLVIPGGREFPSKSILGNSAART
jgi:hypothetical protein